MTPLAGMVFRVLPLLLLTAMAIGATTLGGEAIADSACLFYLVALVLANGVMFSKKKDHVGAFFSPAGLMLNYAGATLLFGSFGFRSGLVVFRNELLPEVYGSLASLGYATSYFIACMAVCLVAVLITHGKSITIHSPVRQLSAPYVWAVVSIVVLIVSASMAIPASIWTSGDVSGRLGVVAALTISYLAWARRSSHRYIVYLSLLAFLMFENIGGKRISLFYIFTVAFMEVCRSKRFRIDFRTILIGSGVVCISLVSLIMLSIARGMGNFYPESLAEALVHVLDYVRSEYFLSMLLQNLEFTRSYFHSVRAVDFIAANPDQMALGSTLVKALFVAIPRDLFVAKPASFIHLYTSELYPEIRAAGGSLPPNFFAEAFWNLGYVGGLAALLSVFSCMNVVFNTFLALMRRSADFALVKYLGTYFYIGVLFRGFGLDGFLALGLLVFVFSGALNASCRIIVSSVPRRGCA